MGKPRNRLRWWAFDIKQRKSRALLLVPMTDRQKSCSGRVCSANDKSAGGPFRRTGKTPPDIRGHSNSASDSCHQAEPCRTSLDSTDSDVDRDSRAACTCRRADTYIRTYTTRRPLQPPCCWRPCDCQGRQPEPDSTSPGPRSHSTASRLFSQTAITESDLPQDGSPPRR